MTPVYQNKFVAIHGTGDCFNACVASILDLPLRQVSDIKPSDTGDWHARWKVWFAKRGLKLEVYFPDEVEALSLRYTITSVYTNRVFPEGHRFAGKKIPHSVIMFNGKLLHDPFPMGDEIREIRYHSCVEPMNEDEKKLHELSMVDGECLHGYKKLCGTCSTPETTG